MGVPPQLVCAADAAVEEPAGGTCQGGENRPSVWGSPGGPLCQATGKQAQRPLRKVVQWEERGADPPQSQGQSRVGRPQRPGSAGGLVVAHWDVHAGSARGGPTQVPFPPRTRGS